MDGVGYYLTLTIMTDYQPNYLSEFEREFELDSESTEGVNEFETLTDEFELEGDAETDNEYDGEGGFELTNEADYLSEFETDNELEPTNEFEFENTPEGRYEARLY